MQIHHWQKQKINKMKKKWEHSIDEWFENKVWTKVPPKYSSPHFFLLTWALVWVFSFCNFGVIN